MAIVQPDVVLIDMDKWWLGELSARFFVRMFVGEISIHSTVFRMLVFGLLFVPRVQEVMHLLWLAWWFDDTRSTTHPIGRVKRAKRWLIGWTVSHPILASRYYYQAKWLLLWVRWLLPIVLSAKKFVVNYLRYLRHRRFQREYELSSHAFGCIQMEASRNVQVVLKLQARFRARRDRMYALALRQEKEAAVACIIRLQREFRRRKTVQQLLHKKRAGAEPDPPFLLRPGTRFGELPPTTHLAGRTPLALRPCPRPLSPPLLLRTRVASHVSRDACD